MSIKIARDYFENNLSAEEANFELEGNFYARTLPESEVQLGFETECKFLLFPLQNFPENASSKYH